MGMAGDLTTMGWVIFKSYKPLPIDIRYLQALENNRTSVFRLFKNSYLGQCPEAFALPSNLVDGAFARVLIWPYPVASGEPQLGAEIGCMKPKKS
jgi:hypothetical protein